ncbi:MAG: hypothetical protein IKV48_08110, partial [Eggerthellaceae bacterium]|nr:hypothetical protein [Eggerthellaceae bacterium]
MVDSEKNLNNEENNELNNEVPGEEIQPIINPYSRAVYEKDSSAIAAANPYSRVHGSANYSKSLKRERRKKGILIGAVVVLCAILAVGVLGFAKLMD